MLSEKEREDIFPEQKMGECMGITDFTLPTITPWVRSKEGIRHSLHAYKKGHYLGSGQAHKILEEAGVHAEGQYDAVLRYAAYIEKK